MSKPKKDKGFVANSAVAENKLLAYISNELSTDEKLQFEKLLENDPFAREALEGLQSAEDKSSVATSLIKLNRKVRERTGLKEIKTVKIHWTNYAWAAVVFGLLIGLGGVMVYFMGQESKQVAMSEKTVLSPADQPAVSSQSPAAGAFNSTVTDSNGNTFQTGTDAGTIMLKDVTANMEGSTDFWQNSENAGKKVDETQRADYKSSNSISANTYTLAADTILTERYRFKANEEANLTKDKEVKQQDAANTDDQQKNLETVTVTESRNLSRKGKEGFVLLEDNQPTSTKVVRGSIEEKETVEKVIVVTLEEAMKNFNSGKDYKKAAEQFDAILREQPANAEALYYGGISDYILGNDKKSEKNFDKLLKAGTKYVDGSNWYKANLLLKKGKKEEAVQLLDELISSNSSYKERAVKRKAEIKF